MATTPSPLASSSLKNLVMAGIVLFLMYMLASYHGLPNVLVVMGILIALFVFVTKRMTFGRRIYAMGGNVKAAALSGIHTERLTFYIFVIMGALAALAGLIYRGAPQHGDAEGGRRPGARRHRGGVHRRRVGAGRHRPGDRRRDRRLHHGRDEQRHGRSWASTSTGSRSSRAWCCSALWPSTSTTRRRPRLRVEETGARPKRLPREIPWRSAAAGTGHTRARHGQGCRAGRVLPTFELQRGG